MIRQITNAGWKVMIAGSVLYGCVQLVNYVGDVYDSFVASNSPHPAASTVEQTTRELGHEIGRGIEKTGELISEGIRQSEPVIERGREWYQNSGLDSVLEND